MKKIKSAFMLLLAVIVALSMVACLPDDADKEIVENGGGEDDGNYPDENEQGKGDGGESSQPVPEKVTITEAVCFSYGGITVTAKELTENSMMGTGIKLLVENSSEKDCSVGVEAVIVNNCMINSFFSCSVAAGKKANDTLYVSSYDLEAAGISNIGQIEIYFYIYDPENYTRTYEAECVTLKTSYYEQMDTTVDDAGYTLYNQNGIKIVGKYVDESTFWGSAVLLYIENTSGQNIGITCDDMSINGYMVSGFFSETVYDEKYAIGTITILSTDLEENDIASIDEVELKFRIYDADTYMTIFETDALSFQAK
ncbi:MAG: hypothetical protein IJY20_04265 [Clostridia bacterium]|nr:hypothetical protein [Clostridia bacterium]